METLNPDLAIDSRPVLNLPNMNYELRRLETFRFWPSNAAVDPQRIAKAGFYSTDNGLEVKCFSCGKCISEWEFGDQVMAKHRNISPDCAFVKNPLECNNVALVPAIGTQADYRREIDRLASFRNWPSPHVKPEDLARNGFYYLRENDKVKCAFCAVELHEWRAGDDPITEHRAGSPECPFLFGCNVNNVAMDHTGSGRRAGEIIADIPPRSPSSASEPSSPEVEIRPFANYEGSISNKELASNPQFGAHAHKPPVHTRYQTKEARLSSFQGWSRPTPTPEALADAGFFYTGKDDNASCFHCNGGLHNWCDDDDPWMEHARWFSQCPYVNIIKGLAYIKQAGTEKPPVLPLSEALALQRQNSSSFDNMGDDVTSFIPSPPPPVNIEQPPVHSRTPSPQMDCLPQEQPSTSSPSSPTGSALQLGKLSLTDDLTKSNKSSQQIIERAKLEATKAKPSSEIESLEEEIRRLKEERMCKICMAEESCVVFLPCGHLTTCTQCAPNLRDCPLCRHEIKATVRSFCS